jgi:hypothetical protein
MESHSLTFSTERGSLKIEIEQDLDLFKQLNSNSSDYYFLSKLKEIKNEILLLNQQKIDNDTIWKLIRFKTNIGSVLHLYQRGDDSYFVSLVEPTEWKNPEYFSYKGSFTLSTKNIWEEIK